MKKFVAFFLVAAMLFSVIAMTGCPGNGPDGPGGPPPEQIIDYGVGEHNFNEEEVKISCFSLFDYEIYAQEDSEEFIDDAVYKRNHRIENAFNVKITPVISKATGNQDLATHYDEVLRWMNSGEPVFDILAMYAYQAGKLVLRGEMFDLRSDYVPYVSTSINNKAEWWPEQINLDCTINGHQFLGVSDLCLTSMEMCYAVIFNKEIEKDNNIAVSMGHSSLYEMVDAGQWTLEKFYQIIKDRHDDAPGSPDGRDETDTYGLVVGGGTDSDAWAFALGFKYIQNDGETTPEIWEWHSGIVTAIEDLRKLYTATGTWKGWGDDYAKRTEFFANGHALFNLSTLLELKSDLIHNMEAEFGVLPYPKLTSDAKHKYKTGTMDHYTMLAIPTSIGIGDSMTRTAVVLEALSKDNHLTVIEPYYNLIVTHKNTTDEESVRMIELIMKGRTYDISTYHYEDLKLVSTVNGGSGNLSYGLFFRYLIANVNDDIAGFWTSNVDQLRNQFDELIEKYNEMGSW